MIVLALAVGLLLDAPGLHKSAYNREPGWQRDTALALTRPLADTSHALYLDRPRAWLKDALGRSHDDDIDVAIVLPPAQPAAARRRSSGRSRAAHETSRCEASEDASEAAKPSKPVPPPKPAFSPSHPLRVWVAGDSLVITPGYALVRAMGASPVFKSVGGVEGQVSTGLERPDVFNWFAEVRRKLDALRPKVVVVSFGGNDDHRYMTGLPDGVSIDRFADAAWKREYARRVGGLIDIVNRAGAYLVWIGLPITRDPSQTERFAIVNHVVRAEIGERPGGAAYIDTRASLAGPHGGYAEYLKTPSGESVDVRASDGVHFAPAGGDIIARQVLAALNRSFDLTSWRAAKQRHESGRSAGRSRPSGRTPARGVIGHLRASRATASARAR